MSGQPETWTVCSEKNLESESCILDEKMGLCAQNLSTLGQEKSKEKDQKADFTYCPLGKQHSQHVHRRTSNSWCSAGRCSILLSSFPHRWRGWATNQPWPGVTQSLEQSNVHCSLPQLALRTAQSLRACWSCKMCVLKIQSQLVLQDFMLQTLKTLNNNILSAFYVAPVNPEGPKALQKLYVVVVVKKLRNHCLSCLQEAEM